MVCYYLYYHIPRVISATQSYTIAFEILIILGWWGVIIAI
jgi:hypothetical protein